MRNTTPRKVAFYLALVLTGLITILLTVVYFSEVRLDYRWLLFGLLLFFVVIYLFTGRVMENFILQKINPIYRTIHNISSAGTDKPLKELTGRDIISEVEDEVKDWATDKSREIERLREMESYRKEFLGNVSHELKTPIFNIQGYILTLLDGGLDDATINRLYLQRTEKSINRMINIVEDLEAIARLETGELELNPGRFDMRRIVDDVVEAQELRAKRRNIKIHIQGQKEKPIWVEADKKWIYDVLTNLVVNSIHYGRENGRTEINFTEIGENILVEVTDNGIGIAERDIPRLFERFYRVDRSRSRDSGGTGLGLAIVKHIIEAHKQTVHVRSRLGEGSTFAFTLRKSKEKVKD